MKKKFIIITLLLELFTSYVVLPLSIVYNFRIAQITRRPIGIQTNKRPNSFSPIFFDLFQKSKALSVVENYAGGLATYNRDIAERYYFRTDIAFAHVHQKVKKKCNVNKTEVDDILFTAGRNFILGKKSQVTLSALFGIPTHPVYTLQRVGFGVGEVGVGLQLDGLYRLIDKRIDLLCGARYSYFIPRTAFDANGTSYRFGRGSIADVLISLQTANPLSHGLEVGYGARWGFDVHASPKISNIDLLNYMRNTFFLAYKYTFLTERTAHRLLLNVGYAFDSKPKLYGYKVFSILGSWGIAF